MNGSLNLKNVLENRSFIGSILVSALASNYSNAQLYNPAGSGKRLALRRIDVSLGTGGVVQWRINSTALANARTAYSKLGFGAGGVGQIRDEQKTTLIGTLITTFLSPATSTTNINFDPEPIVLEEGDGIIINPGVVNNSIYVTFQWIEI